MVIYVSDLGIFRSETQYPYTNTASVNKVSAIKPTDASTESVAREAQKAFVAENTPAYTISISSMGKAAVKSMKSLSEAMNNNKLSADIDNKTNQSSLISKPELKDNDNARSDIYKTSVDFMSDSNNMTVASDEDAITISRESTSLYEDTETTASKVNTNNLARYSDFQLQQMLNDGTITRSEYNNELGKRSMSSSGDASTQNTAEVLQNAAQNPVMKQAMAAYNYQMAYQINAAITQ